MNTPKGLRWASITFDMLCLAGLGFGLALTCWVWLPYLAWKAWRQRLEAEMPDPKVDYTVVMDPATKDFSTEGHVEPRNSSEPAPPENHAA